ncbi:unnamed protein product [Hermetia illucens]|uniref:Uncharacterized protein n=1 Tax=Hermetia illucens TaxID=343691 RepID=A0A7R8Z219_HERIL|nr:terminal uridylyltransferase Tailor [Hermetia illucens]CAD7092538.1 unnamed protein product [Hermetia illucens]
MGDVDIPAGVSEQLCDINLEIRTFLEKFANFRQTNVVDSVLCQNLCQLVEEIESYMDSNPEEIPSPMLSDVNIDFKKNHLEQVVFCNKCQVKIANRVHKIRKHLTSEKHISGQIKGERDHATKQVKLPKKMAAFVRSNFSEYLTGTAATADALKQIPAYDAIRNSLTRALKNIYPNMKVHFFGSRMNGLGNKDSDLDIFIDIDDKYNTLLGSKQAKQNVQLVQNELQKRTDEWRAFTAILSARTPILRVYNHKHSIDCDISFSSLGECNTLLISYLIGLQPICQQMCLFLKKWFKTSQCPESFSSYMFSLMVIFHLQRQSYLPAVFVLQHCVDPSCIGPWQGNFARLPLAEFNMEKIPQTPENILQQLISFFNFYASVDYANNIICPFTGSLVVRKNFNNMKEVFARYDYYRLNSAEKEELRLGTPICIQDPLEHNHNVAKAITNKALSSFANICRLTAMELKIRQQSENKK